MLNPKAKVGLLVSVLASTVAAQAAAAEPVKLATPKVTSVSALSLTAIVAKLALLKGVLAGAVAN